MSDKYQGFEEYFKQKLQEEKGILKNSIYTEEQLQEIYCQEYE